jgi:hypothetical protein
VGKHNKKDKKHKEKDRKKSKHHSDHHKSHDHDHKKSHKEGKKHKSHKKHRHASSDYEDSEVKPSPTKRMKIEVNAIVEPIVGKVTPINEMTSSSSSGGPKPAEVLDVVAENPLS